MRDSFQPHPLWSQRCTVSIGPPLTRPSCQRYNPGAELCKQDAGNQGLGRGCKPPNLDDEKVVYVWILGVWGTLPPQRISSISGEHLNPINPLFSPLSKATGHCHTDVPVRYHPSRDWNTNRLVVLRNFCPYVCCKEGGHLSNEETKEMTPRDPKLMEVQPPNILTK